MNDAPHPQKSTRRLTRQTIRYLTVGAIAGGCDLGLNSLLTHLGSLTPLQANLISRPIGGLVSFTLNKHWTFENKGQASTGRQFLRYASVWLVLFSGSQSLVWFYHHVVGLIPDLTKLAAECTLGVVSFLLQKFWAFR